MNRFQRSWQLLRSSLEVMQRNKQLLWFPLLSMACVSVAVIVFLMPIAFQHTGHPITSGAHWEAVVNSVYTTAAEPEATGSSDSGVHIRVGRSWSGGLRPLTVGYFAVIYFVSMYLATFFNVALYKEILNALRGEPVSISEGLQFAVSRWQAILMWTLFAGLVGYIIKTLEERFGFIGQLILRLLGTAWSIACVFVIPVMVTQENASNPLAVLKQSALTLKKTWGESLIGYVGISFGGGLVVLASLLSLGLGIGLCVALHLYWLIIGVVLMWFMAMMIWSYLLGIASQVFRCALYLYATEGNLPAPYTDEMAAMAWKYRKH